jgi:hypothetical protein
MQMELRKIDGQNFIVQHIGKKELVRTPREALDALVQDITGHYEAIDEIHAGALDRQQRIEKALLDGESTTALRAEIDSANARLDGFAADIAAANETATQIYLMLDADEVRTLMQAQEERLAALVAPYDSALKESA